MWTRCATTNGSACGTWFRVGAKVSAGRAATTACLWTRCCGWRAPGRVGATSPKRKAFAAEPERYGNYQAVKRRYYRWVGRDALGGFLAVLAADADLEWLMIDSTIMRAHQHAAGARRSKGGLMPKGWAVHAAA